MGQKQALLKPSSIGLLLSVQLIPTSTITKCKAQRNRSCFCQWLTPPFALPRGTFSDAGGHSAACLAPTYPPGAHRSHISFLLGSPKKINSFPEAGVMTCVSAKASFPTFPDLQMREASFTSWKNVKSKASLLARTSWRSRKRGMCTSRPLPPGK